MMGWRKRLVAVAALAILVLGLGALGCGLGGCRRGGGPGSGAGPGVPPGGGTGPGAAPGTGGAPTEAVTAWSPPWGPVQLAAETAGRVLALPGQLSEAASAPDLKGAWVFHLRQGSSAGAQEMTLFGDGLLAGGRAWRGTAARAVWQAVAAEVCAAGALGRVVEGAEAVRIVPEDVPAATVTLDAGARRRVSEGAAALGTWGGQSTEPPSTFYPHYRLDITAGGLTVRLRWQFDHVVAAWDTDTGGYGQADFLDTELALWHLACALAPVPDPGRAAGPARLFLYQEVRAEGGPLGQAMQAPPGRVPALVSCLVRGRPAAEGARPPAGEEPVTVTFSEGSGRLAPCTLELYADGFVLEGRSYEAPGVQQGFLTTMNAG